MIAHDIVDREAWLAARKRLLQEEKEFTRARDALAAKRREMPWLRVDQTYVFDGPEGRVGLGELFGPHRQLLVYHFMFAPGWTKPCKSCSFWADNFNGAVPHLARRDTRLVAVSRAPLETLAARAAEARYVFPWYSQGDGAFNYDFGVSFRSEEVKAGKATYNYAPNARDMTDLPGISAFVKADGEIFHTYSAYARGLDVINGAYHMLDLTALGRQEDALPFPMSWVRLKEDYEAL